MKPPYLVSTLIILPIIILIFHIKKEIKTKGVSDHTAMSDTAKILTQTV